MYNILLYINILIMNLALYIPRYLKYKYNKKLEVFFENKPDNKIFQKKYMNFYYILVLIDVFLLFSSFAIGIIYYNTGRLSDIIRNQTELMLEKKVLDYSFIILFGISLVISYFVDEKRLKIDNEKYNINCYESILFPDIFFRTYGISTSFIILYNLKDILFYQYLDSTISFSYLLLIIILIILIPCIMGIKSINLFFKNKNIFFTIIFIFIICLLAYSIDYLFTVLIF